MGTNKHTGRRNRASANQLANLRNFKDMAKEDPEKLSEISRKGAQASSQAITRKRTFKQACQWVAEQPAFKSTNTCVNAILKQFEDEGLTNADAMAIALSLQAINKGDFRAFSAFRDTTGETIASQVDLSSNQPMTINIRTVGAEEQK